MPRIPFERFEFGVESFESISNDSNLESNGSNPFRMVQICIGMVRIPLKWFECGFESFKFLLNGSNLHSNASNPFQKVRILFQNL